MNNIEVFYNNLLFEIEKLANEKQIDKAIDILVEELKAPYIPIEIFEKFEEKLSELQFIKNYLNEEVNIKKFSKEEFISKIVKETIIETDIIYFFQKFNTPLDNIEISSFEKMIKSHKIDNSKKILLLENLQQIELDHNFNFYNNKISKDYVVNSINVMFIESIDFFVKTNKLLREIMNKEPSILELCFTIIYSFYQYYFPYFKFEYSYKDFTLAVINYVEHMLKGTKLKKGKVYNDLSNVVNDIK